MTDQPEAGRPLAPYVDLLGAHIDLISDTSEETALQLSDGLSRLRKNLIELSEMPGANGAGLQNAVELSAELQALLQTQDILRQQVVAVRNGLSGLSEVSIDDVSSLIDGLKDGYVMPEQWAVHARITGEAEEDTLPKGPTFF